MHDFRRADPFNPREHPYPPVDEEQQRATIARVSFDNREKQHELSMAKKRELEQEKKPGGSNYAKSTIEGKHHAWCATQGHSLSRSKPMWLAYKGQYDGAVHLPSNLLRALLFKMFEMAKMFDAVPSRAGSSAEIVEGSCVHAFIMYFFAVQNRPIAVAFQNYFDESKSDKEKDFRPTSDQRNRIWRQWRPLMDALTPTDITEHEQARLTEIDVHFGILVAMHPYMTKVEITRAEIADGKWLGRALLILFRVASWSYGPKEFAASIEFWWLMEYDFDDLKISTTSMIGPQIVGAMQALERGHKDLKSMALRCAARGMVWMRTLTLLAIIFVANKMFPEHIEIPTHGRARNDYDGKEHGHLCRRCRVAFDEKHARAELDEPATPEEQRLLHFAAPLCVACVRSHKYVREVVRPGKYTGYFLQVEQQASSHASRTAAAMRTPPELQPTLEPPAATQQEADGDGELAFAAFDASNEQGAARIETEENERVHALALTQAAAKAADELLDEMSDDEMAGSNAGASAAAAADSGPATQGGGAGKGRARGGKRARGRGRGKGKGRSGRAH